MAELEIGPENIGVGGRIPSLPTAPIYSEIEKTSKDIESRALVLLAHIKKQEQDTINTNALISSRSKVNQLDQNVVNIHDPDHRISVYKTGLTDIQDQIKKEFPNISDSAFKTIQLQLSNDFREHTLKVIADKTKQGHEDFPITLHDLALATARAKSSQEQRQLELHAHDYIVKALDNGFIDATRAKYEIAHFHEQVQENHLGELVATHPEEILKLNYENSGVTWQKFNEFTKQANEKINYEAHEGQRKFNAMIDQAKDQMLSDPAHAADYAAKYPSLKYMAEDLVHHKIVDTDETAANYYMNEMNNARTLDELHNIKQDAIRHGVSGGSFKLVLDEFTEKSRDLSDEHGRLAADTKFRILNEKLPPYNGDFDFDKSELNFRKRIAHETGLFNYHKNPKEINDDEIRINKEIDDFYEKRNKIELTAPESKGVKSSEEVAP